MNVRRKHRNDHHSARADDCVFHRSTHVSFARTCTFGVHIGGVAHQETDAFAAKFSKAFVIELFTIGRRWIDLEITCVNDGAG